MKRLTQILSFIFLLAILSGCVDIPLGDSKIKISTNGVEIVEKDETGKEQDRDGKGGKTNAGESNNVNTDMHANNDEEESEDALKDENNFASMNENGSLEDNQTATNNDIEKPTGLTNEQNESLNTAEEACDFDHSMFLEKVEGYDYLIPECAELYDLIERDRNVTGLFFIENEDWQEIKEMYEEELETEDITRTNVELKEQMAHYPANLNLKFKMFI